MSLFYVNEHLITDEVTGENTWAKTNESYKRIMIKTAEGAVMRNKDTDEFEPLSRAICVHNMSNDASAKTRISVTQKPDAKGPKVTVRTSSDTNYDSDIFVVAIPYEGLIKPFSHNEEALAIFRSLVLRSDRFTIKHEDATYRRVVYFVVRPNYTRLGSDGWYTSDCNLEVSFLASTTPRGKDANPETDKWKVHTVTVRFGENGKYELTSKDEELPYDGFDPEAVRNQPICALVPPVMLDENGKAPDRPRNGGQYKSNNYQANRMPDTDDDLVDRRTKANNKKRKRRH